MKKTFFITTLLMCTLMGANASMVLINFGSTNGGAATGDKTLIGGQTQNPVLDGNTWNQFYSPDRSGTIAATDLKCTDGTGSGITISGAINAGTGAGGAFASGSLPSSGILADYQGYGNAPNGGVHTQGSPSTMTFSLSAGTYVFTVLSVRANNYNATNTGSLTLSGDHLAFDADGTQGRIYDGSSINELTSTSTANGQQFSGLVFGGDADGLNTKELTWTFTATEDTTVSLTADGWFSMNMLTIQTIPEPATASLGLASLMMRRRRH